jgi:hypothetical protein
LDCDCQVPAQASWSPLSIRPSWTLSPESSVGDSANARFFWCVLFVTSCSCTSSCVAQPGGGSAQPQDCPTVCCCTPIWPAFCVV